MSEEALSSVESARVNRVLAFIVDFLLLSVVTALTWFVFFILRGIVGAGSILASSGESPAAAATGTGLGILGIVLSLVMWALLIAIIRGYFTYLTQRSGQTLGMRLLDVSVVDANGGPVTQKQALKRTALLLAPMPLMALSSAIIPLLGFPIALVMMGGWLLVEAAVLFVDDQAQRLGDRVANTYVVESAA
jgi:uncharacterized RDD family membrane protein YckC